MPQDSAANLAVDDQRPRLLAGWKVVTGLVLIAPTIAMFNDWLLAFLRTPPMATITERLAVRIALGAVAAGILVGTRGRSKA